MTFIEKPEPDEFSFSSDDDRGNARPIYMQCRICLETWEVVNLQDALTQYQEHICRTREPTESEKSRASHD